MKYVQKRQPPALFEAWKNKANADWAPKYVDLQKPEKQDLHLALLSEQGWVCCYCGRSVSMIDSHIEHFRPQGQRADLVLTYENLLASCIRETSPGMPLHCGHAKGDNFDEALHLSPLDPACENYFAYTLQGEVIATDPLDERAGYMLGLLRLNIAFLRNRREEVIRRTFDADFLGSVNAAELQVLREAFRIPDADGQVQGFGHVLARYSEQRLADITG